MFANYNLIRSDFEKRRENREFDIQIRQLLRADGFKPRILQCRGFSAMHDNLDQRVCGGELANAAAQTASAVQSDKGASGALQDFIRREIFEEITLLHRRRQGAPGDLEKRLPLAINE
jgi:hypothetical protein